MITPIYHSLSEKLEEYIHDRGLSGRLPGLGPLSREFGVNQLTMSKAIRLLEEKGLVTINGTRGTFVNEERRSRPVYKVIGLVGVTKLDERDYILDNLEPYAERSGYHLLGITGSMELFATRTQLLTTFPVDGLIFCYSSLTSGIAVAGYGRLRSRCALPENLRLPEEARTPADRGSDAPRIR